MQDNGLNVQRFIVSENAEESVKLSKELSMILYNIVIPMQFDVITYFFSYLPIQKTQCTVMCITLVLAQY